MHIMFCPQGELKENVSAHGLTIVPSYDLYNLIFMQFFSKFSVILKKLEDVPLEINIFEKLRITEINSRNVLVTEII